MNKPKNIEPEVKAPKETKKKATFFPDDREGCGIVKDEDGNVILKVFPDTDVKKELPGYTVE